MTATETLAAEHRRLWAEYTNLYRTTGRTPDQQARMGAVHARLAEIEATPPPGYMLPPAAADLVEHARAHGWAAAVQWSRSGEPFVDVTVARRVQPGEGPGWWGPRWWYRICWHSRGCPAGRMRLSGITAETPEDPAPHDAPSVRAVRAVIAAHPAPGRPA
jgi:hypothetical protein